MSFDIKFFGNYNKLNEADITLEMRPDKVYEEVYNFADMKCIFGNISLQAISTVDLTIEIKYSNWYEPTNANKEEIWFDYKTIDVSANTPILEKLEIPFCKFMKYIITPGTIEHIEYATICTVSA